jgi:hypothetical protein
MTSQISLPFYIAPLDAELYKRTQMAHVSRGFCWLLDADRMAANKPVRSMLDLPFALGLHRHVRFFGPQTRKANVRKYILGMLETYWTRDLADLNLQVIDLLFSGLPAEDQSPACYMVSRYFYSTFPFLSSPPTHQHKVEYMQLTDKLPPDIVARLTDSLASLEQSLIDKDPMMPNHLRNTHAVLISYPETVHLLDDREIALIIDAAEVHTKTEIVKAVAKGASTGGTRKKISISDL